MIMLPLVDSKCKWSWMPQTRLFIGTRRTRCLQLRRPPFNLRTKLAWLFHLLFLISFKRIISWIHFAFLFEIIRWSNNFFWSFFVAPQLWERRRYRWILPFLSPSPFTWVERGHAKVNRIQGIIHESWAASFNLKHQQPDYIFSLNTCRDDLCNDENNNGQCYFDGGDWLNKLS